jgi:hypothetical protein
MVSWHESAALPQTARTMFRSNRWLTSVNLSLTSAVRVSGSV